MNPRSRSARAAAVLTVVGVLLVSGRGGDEADTRAVSHSAATPVAPKPTLSPKEEPVPVQQPPTELPPGDPGLDAPPVPDPGRPDKSRDHEEPARTVVPDEALLDTQTVSSVLGGTWEQTAAASRDCTPLDAGGVAQRSVTYRNDADHVVQTVATHASLAAADRAVAEVSRQLDVCGWTVEPDPRLGTASAAASSPDGSRTAVVISAEGVTVTVVGSAGAAVNPARWTSLLDLALGTSCAAAPHGCH